MVIVKSCIVIEKAGELKVELFITRNHKYPKEKNGNQIPYQAAPIHNCSFGERFGAAERTNDSEATATASARDEGGERGRLLTVRRPVPGRRDQRRNATDTTMNQAGWASTKSREMSNDREQN
ncbi:hypothetical protein AAHA92_14960 [Salvia divinorum]|uniref:Uncharacterized protein n=1 Tax=Salvia divinorum TaxID=28513 RepID=A0ABD1HDH5_SALDI